MYVRPSFQLNPTFHSWYCLYPSLPRNQLQNLRDLPRLDTFTSTWCSCPLISARTKEIAAKNCSSVISCLATPVHGSHRCKGETTIQTRIRLRENGRVVEENPDLRLP